MNEIYRAAKTVLAASILSLPCTSCDITTADNLPVSAAQGLSIRVIANRHLDDTTAEIAAAVYRDGRPLELTGGDLFRASSGGETAYLKTPYSPIAGYAGSIETGGRPTIGIEVVHDALIAREDRWYPVDLFLIDPGPGPLVGRTASASFPDPVTITAPQANTEYTSIDEQLHIEWLPGSGDESMQLVGAIECNDGLSTSRYGIQRTLDQDDGFETVPLDEIIADSSQSLFSFYITPLAQALLQQLLNELSDGNIDPDYVVRNIEANPVVSRCEIRLVVQRVSTGTFDEGFDSGYITASSSADVLIVYNPVAPF